MDPILHPLRRTPGASENRERHELHRSSHQRQDGLILGDVNGSPFLAMPSRNFPDGLMKSIEPPTGGPPGSVAIHTKGLQLFALVVTTAPVAIREVTGVPFKGAATHIAVKHIIDNKYIQIPVI